MTPTPDHGEQSYRGSGRLTGKKTVVTGADSGIGRAVAIAYAREGADVLISYLDEHGTPRRPQRWVEEAGRQAVLCPGDLQDPAHCRSIIDLRCASSAGSTSWSATRRSRCPARTSPTSPTRSGTGRSPSTCRRFFHLTKAALPHMGPGSSIIGSSSVNSDMPEPDLLPYAATKAGIANMCASMAQAAGRPGHPGQQRRPRPGLDPADPGDHAARAGRELRRGHAAGPGRPAGRAGPGVRAARLRRGQLRLRRPGRGDRRQADPLRSSRGRRSRRAVGRSRRAAGARGCPRRAGGAGPPSWSWSPATTPPGRCRWRPWTRWPGWGSGVSLVRGNADRELTEIAAGASSAHPESAWAAGAAAAGPARPARRAAASGHPRRRRVRPHRVLPRHAARRRRGRAGRLPAGALGGRARRARRERTHRGLRPYAHAVRPARRPSAGRQPGEHRHALRAGRRGLGPAARRAGVAAAHRDRCGRRLRPHRRRSPATRTGPPGPRSTCARGTATSTRCAPSPRAPAAERGGQRTWVWISAGQDSWTPSRPSLAWKSSSRPGFASPAAG